MPVIGIELEKLKSFTDKSIENEKLIKILTELGCDVEGIEKLRRFKCPNCGGITEITGNEEKPAYCSMCGIDLRTDDIVLTEIEPSIVIRMELLAVRADIFDAGGLSRALKGYLGIETGLKKYRLYPARETIQVSPEMKEIRPFIVSAIIKNIKFDDSSIKTIMKLQENLHWALGRNRKHASIGVYDYDKIKGGFIFTAEEPDYKFVPLGYDVKEENLISLAKILEEHPKGKNYSFLLNTLKKYPILRDSHGTVLSMPPIINSENTRVTMDTTNLFIDVTGPIERVINKTLNIIVSSILEYFPEAICEEVMIKYKDRELITPDFSVEKMDLSVSKTSDLIGIELNSADICTLLKKMRHGTEEKNDDIISVSIAPYRNDIIHARDLMEDVAIAYGYHNIKPKLIKRMTIGKERDIEQLSNTARAIMCGMNFMEITTLMLTSPQAHYNMLNLKEDNRAVIIENPISMEQTILRTHLISGLMETFKLNIHNDLPQRIFEVNDVSYIDKNFETGASDHKRISAGIIGSIASYSEIKSHFDAFISEMKINVLLMESSSRLFISGRGADIVLNNNKIGVIGEISPEVLERYHLVNPVVIFEMSLE